MQSDYRVSLKQASLTLISAIAMTKVLMMRNAPLRTSLSTVLFATVATSVITMQPLNAATPLTTTLNSIEVVQDVKIRLGARGAGKTWRGSVGDIIAITIKKRGTDEVFEGRLMSYREISRTLATINVKGTQPDAMQDRTFIVADIVKIETIADAADTPAANTAESSSNDTPTQSPSKATSAERTPNTPEPQTTHAWGFPTDAGNGDPNMPKIFLLPIQGGVGDGTRHNEMKQIGEIADAYGPGQIIVLKVNSPGGLVAEADLIHETLVDLKKRHRLIAWVEEAISAAAYTSLHCNEIYFMKTGALGSATMFAGGKAIEGVQLDMWVKKFGDVAEESGHPRALAESMCTNREMCSYDRAVGDKGPVVYDNMDGEIPLSTSEENLTINATAAYECGFADGIADNEEELAKHLKLPRWYETTDEGRKIHKNWQKQLEMAKVEIPRLLMQLQGQIGTTNDPLKNLNRRLTACRKLIAWARRFGLHTSMMTGLPPMEYLEDIEAELKEQIRRMKQQGN